MRSMTRFLCCMTAIALLASCGEDTWLLQEVTNAPLALEDSGQLSRVLSDALSGITVDSLTQRLRTLAGPEFEGRASGSEGGKKARRFIAEQFEAAGLEPGNNGSYIQPFRSRNVTGAANVIGVLPGTDPTLAQQAIVIGAHYDHLGKGWLSTTYFGADDNASGTDVLVEVANAAAKLREKLKRTLVFVAFDAEEKGLRGSSYYVSHPAVPIEDTVYMINLDMVGYLAKQKDLLCLGAETSTLARDFLLDILERYPSTGDADMTSPAGCCSDHIPFENKDIPLVFFHTGVRHSPFHTANDTWDRIDYEGLRDISSVTLELTWRLARSSSSPQADAVVRSGASFVEDTGLDHGVAPFQE